MSRKVGALRPDAARGFVRGPAGWRIWLVVPAASFAGCATVPAPATEEEAADPVGIYDLSMSSAIQVSDGTLEIAGEPGNYRGFFSVGPLSVAVVGVETGIGVLNVQADLPEGTLILRLKGDGHRFAGNWVLGTRRGTITAEKRSRGSGG